MYTKKELEQDLLHSIDFTISKKEETKEPPPKETSSQIQKK